MSNILPDLSQIAFVSHENRGRSTQPREDTDLLKIFNAVLNNGSLEADEEQLNKIIFQDLTIDMNEIDERLLSVVREALVYYMTAWPGWQRTDEYYKGELSFTEWFGKFRNFLILKSHFLIKNAETFASATRDTTISNDVAIQTQVHPDKKVAPYTLCIGGPPYVLNNILFEESDGDIVIMQQQQNPWCNLTLKAFLNWPYVSVSVKLPDICFTRTNTHKFERYMSFCDNPTVLPEEHHINHIKKTSDVSEHELVPYSYDFIASYLRQLYRTLKGFSGTSSDRFPELKAIFIEFLSDIKEVNLHNCSMCTNTSVEYNIGKCKYIRKNRVKKTANQNVIDYYEILTPQVDFTLNYFNAEQDPLNEKIAFKNIDRLLNYPQVMIEKLIFDMHTACIEYNCTLCSKIFSGPNAYYTLTQHFSEQHKAQQSVKCCKCRKHFDVVWLAEQRWLHKCI